MISQLQQIELFSLIQVASPWLVIFAAAVVLILISSIIKEDVSIFAPIFSLVAIALAFGLSWQRWLSGGLVTDAMNGMLVFDRITFIFWMIILLVAAFVVALSISYLSARGFSRPEYYALILFSVFGMGCLVSATDLLMVFLGIEVMSIPIYVLTTFLRKNERSNEAALKYFLMGVFASAFLLMGIAFIFGSAGTTKFSMLATRLPEIISSDKSHLCFLGMALLSIGLAFKIAAVPFHSWVPDVYDGAATPITTFMATAVKAAAFAAFLRLSISVFGAGGTLWVQTIVVLSVITMFLGNIAAIAQEDLKRMLAYSSIAHAGYILVGFPALATASAGTEKAIIFYLAAYVLMTAGAFAVVVAMDCDKGGVTKISQLAGLSKKRPLLAAAFSLFLLSLLGVPPTIGFFGKYYLFLGAVKSGFVWLVVAAVVNTALSAYYYLRPIVVMYFNETEENFISEPLSPPVVAVVTLAVAGVIYFGLFPNSLLAMLGKTF